MLTKGTEPKQALGNETNLGDEKRLEQEEGKPSLEWKELLEEEELLKQKGGEEWLEWKKYQLQPAKAGGLKKRF